MNSLQYVEKEIARCNSERYELNAKMRENESRKQVLEEIKDMIKIDIEKGRLTENDPR